LAEVTDAVEMLPDRWLSALELGAKAISGLRRDASADARLGRRERRTAGLVLGDDRAAGLTVELVEEVGVEVGLHETESDVLRVVPIDEVRIVIR